MGNIQEEKMRGVLVGTLSDNCDVTEDETIESKNKTTLNELVIELTNARTKKAA